MDGSRIRSNWERVPIFTALLNHCRMTTVPSPNRPCLVESHLPTCQLQTYVPSTSHQRITSVFWAKNPIRKSESIAKDLLPPSTLLTPSVHTHAASRPSHYNTTATSFSCSTALQKPQNLSMRHQYTHAPGHLF